MTAFPTEFEPCRICAVADAVPFQVVDDRRYWRCPACEGTFLDPRQLPSTATEAATYQLHRNAPDDAGYRTFLGRLADPLLARLAPGSGGLDFGCGPGPALGPMLEEHGHRVAAWDPLYAADASVLARRYDFVTCTEVVEHFHRPAETFATLWSLLHPGGWLAIMTTFQTDDAAFARWRYRRDPTHVAFYRETTIRRLAASVRWHCEIPVANVALLRRPRDD